MASIIRKDGKNPFLRVTTMNADSFDRLTRSTVEADVANYRCYLLDKSNKVEHVIDFGAASDTDARDEAENVEGNQG